ncbi:MAG: sigma-70 family RNA polymerase sigma factor, partial [Anaerolineae bacterium]|nr:sigma-70 family RNA polymerase sigma factor [Anaerolineae bacterium]NIQ78361.1 sigma-70 family RNA polymerase sigma factor [Anaerolineae bacterium]
ESLEAIRDKQPYLEFADETGDVEAIIETRELQRLVNSVLATLRPEQRLLIVLRDFEQLSYEEISLIMEMSVSNVKSRLHRARMTFKNRIKPHLDHIRGVMP